MTKQKSQPVQQESLKPPLWQQPIFLIGSLVVVVFTLLGLYLASRGPAYVPEITGGAHVAVDKEEVDYGDVKFDTTVVSEFKVKNVGDEPLIILGEPVVEIVEGC